MSLARPRRLLRPLVVLAAVLASLAFVPPAGAQLRLDITGGRPDPVPVAVSPLAGGNPAAADYGARIAEVVENDLRSSGLFRPIERAAFIQGPQEMRPVPRFADWRQINAQALVTGAIEEAPGRLVAEFRLWDVFAGQQLSGLRLAAEPSSWRRVAHRIADEVYARITGERGYFDTRVVYVSETGPRTRRVKRLALMDQDGANHRFLTDGGDLVLTPRFDPAGATVAYMAYRGPEPQIYLHDLASGRDSLFGRYPGMTFAPRFSPDGRTLALTLAEDGNSDVYLQDLPDGAPRRLTDHPAIDTSPSFAPDGARIAFNSDRAGSPQIYVMNRDGSDQRRVSFGEGRYSAPVWSPRGDLIAFVNQKGGAFSIGVMRPDGADERLITRSYQEESPSWAPNGRVVLFGRETAPGVESRLFSIDIAGANERALPTPLAASDPDWSALIP